MAVVVRVEGLKKTVRTLQKFGIEVSDLKDVFHKIGVAVANDAKDNVNSRTGKLARSIRASKAKNKATVRAGRKSVPYAGPIHWGVGERKGKRGPHNIAAQMFLYKAAEENRYRSVHMLETGIGNLIRKLDLN